jgi:hypothetical protein
VAAGSGAARNVFVKITNSDTSNSADTGVGKFAYLRPVIVDVQPILAKTGDDITVRGLNFGVDVSKLRLDIGFPASVGGATVRSYLL